VAKHPSGGGGGGGGGKCEPGARLSRREERQHASGEDGLELRGSISGTPRAERGVLGVRALTGVCKLGAGEVEEALRVEPGQGVVVDPPQMPAHAHSALWHQSLDPCISCH
jgi:hypothetical protein